MSFSCLTIWLLIIQFNFVTVLGEECPVCTNKYDHNSCTQKQLCDAGMNYCELIVRPDDFYSLEYVCKQALECANQATVVCDPSVNKTCIYCCDGPTICLLQREELYNSEFPASGLFVPSTTPDGLVGTTLAVSSATTSTDGDATKSSTAHVTTPTTTTTLPEVVIECPVCSDTYDHTCLGIQKCPLGTDAICQLVINTTGLLRLEYQCGHYEVCAELEADGCHPEVNNTCVYCCSDPIICQLQRDDLFTYEFLELGLLAPSTKPDSTVGSTSTNPPATRSTDSPILSASTNPPATRSTGAVTTDTLPALVTSTTSTTTPSPPDSAVIECPDCSDNYDHTMCSGIQKCPGANAVCQLVLHSAGLLRLEYQCEKYEVCAELEADGCHPEVNNTCVYCCSDPITCQLQRDDLFTYELPSLGLPTDISATTTAAATASTATTTAATTPITRTATDTKQTPVTATSQTRSTVTPATADETTATSTSTQITTTTTASTETQTTATTATPTATQTAATTTTPQTTESSTTPAVATIRCVQCGNFSGHHSPCTPDEQALNQLQACPDYLPYCFTSFTQNGTGVPVVYKGCAAADFCSLEYELSSTKEECKDPDLYSRSHVSCGYCCNSNACNARLKPANASLVVFP